MGIDFALASGNGTTGTTLVEVLRRRATEQPDRVSFVFLKDGESEEASLSHASLDMRARSIGAWLSAISGAGERALLLYPSGLEFVAALFGCFYGGLTAVPAYPLESANSKRAVSRLRTIVQSARPIVALTDAASLRVVKELIPTYPDLKDIRWISTEEIPDELASEWQCPAATAEAIAVLQYTSGSTTTPRGVMLSHRNVIENLEMLRRTFGYSATNTFVSWLPLAHDLGLFGHVVLPLYLGAPSVLMTPEDFVRKPLRWLRAISRYKSVVTRGPNFAFELCAKRITAQEREGLDLTSLHTASCGGEPVRCDTLDRLMDAFGPCGFRREAFLSSYGLAEATLLVSAARNPRVFRVQRAELERNLVVGDCRNGVSARTLLSVGVPSSGQRVVIVDPVAHTECAPERVGEIRISGPNVGMGYWNRPDATADTFCAMLQDTGEGPFLRTGDLGFFQSGEIFITGRIKDLIILRGRNYYPEDIELTVEKCHKAMRAGGAAAFSVEIGKEERLIIVQELGDPKQTGLEEIIRTVRRSLFDAHGVSAYGVVLVQPRGIPKTSSGKLQRRACKEAWLAGWLDIIEQRLEGDFDEHSRAAGFVAPGTAAEKRLAKIWSEVLNVETIGIHDSFVDLGGDSLAAISCVAAISAAFDNAEVSTEIFLYAPTLASMADVLAGKGKLKQPWTKVFPYRENGSGIPLVLVSQGLECRNMARHLGPDHPVFSIHSSFWDNPTPNLTIDQFAAECVDALRRFQPQGPYALGGWCTAGVVALEMARQLESSGGEVLFVALFDARGVYTPPMGSFRRFVAQMWRNVGRLAWRIGREGPKAITETVRGRITHLRQEPLASQTAVRQVLRSWSRNPWPGRMLHFWAAERSRGRFESFEFTWGGFSSKCVFYDTPGDHCSILLEPNVAVIGDVLTAELDSGGGINPARPAAR
jgi:acyl-CoA synthetase (AMP-forming)/AMP-acid ligase II/thioesterase domain-containing protein/acyl carrier protein